MSISKSDISKKISGNIDMTKLEASSFLDKFLLLLKKQVMLNDVKISGFGTFRIRLSPKRIGRNPKTKESYIIQPMRKVTLKVSNKLKKILNWNEEINFVNFCNTLS